MSEERNEKEIENDLRQQGIIPKHIIRMTRLQRYKGRDCDVFSIGHSC